MFHVNVCFSAGKSFSWQDQRLQCHCLKRPLCLDSHLLLTEYFPSSRSICDCLSDLYTTHLSASGWSSHFITLPIRMSIVDTSAGGAAGAGAAAGASAFSVQNNVQDYIMFLSKLSSGGCELECML